MITIFRNEEAANRIISDLKSAQPDGELIFIKKDLTLLQSVDEVCEEIKTKEKKLNVLFMSQGTMSLKGRDGDQPSSFPSIHPWGNSLITCLMARNFGGLGPKTSEKLLRPTPLRSPTHPSPTIRLPRNLPRSLRIGSRRGIQFIQSLRSGPEEKLQHQKRRHSRHRHDGFRIRRSRQTPPRHLFYPLQPRNGQNGIHERNRASGPTGREYSHVPRVTFRGRH